MLGDQVLHHVRRLIGLVGGQALLALVPVGDHGARLGGDAGVAAGDEGRFDHGVRVGEGLVDGADLELALEAEIVTERSVDHRRLGIERGFCVSDGGEGLVVDLYQFGGVLGLRARARDHGAHRLALPAGAVDSNGMLRRRFEALEMREHADPWRHHLGELGAGDNGDNAGRFLRRDGLDRGKPGVSMRRAHKGHMRHTRQHNVADILAAALRQPVQIGPRHRAADVGVRPVERGEHGRGVVGDFHRASPRALFTSP